MKNKSIILIFCGLLFLVLGCGITDRNTNKIQEKQANVAPVNSNKSVGDQITEDVLREKTGVPECDEVLDYFADQSRNQDDNIATKAMKELVFNKIRQSLKESIEKNQNDKAKMAQNCKEYKAQLDKFQSEQNSNK